MCDGLSYTAVTPRASLTSDANKKYLVFPKLMQMNILYIFPIGNLSGNNTQSLWTYLRLPTIECTKKTNDNMATYVP